MVELSRLRPGCTIVFRMVEAGSCTVTSSSLRGRSVGHGASSVTELGWVLSSWQELCESRGGRPGLSVLTSHVVSVDVKQYGTAMPAHALLSACP